MFYKPKGNVIISDEGFSVTRIDLYHIKYEQGDKSIIIPFEWLMTKPVSIVIYERNVTEWEPPNSEVPLGNKTIKLIINNISRALVWDGVKVEFEPLPSYRKRF